METFFNKKLNMKKIILSVSIAFVAVLGAAAQSSDAQNATLSTSIPQLIALRPYTGISLANGQNLSATVTNASDVLSTNNFAYSGNGSMNQLAYKIYSNVLYKVSMQASPTATSNDQLNNYITFTAASLPSPQNGGVVGGSSTTLNGPDHIILAPANTKLSDATSSSMDILNNPSASTGAGHPPVSVFDPANTDFAAFGISFAVHPGFSVFPGNFTTNLVITATSL